MANNQDDPITDKPRNLSWRVLHRVSLTGLFFGGVSFALSFTPSLIPRPWIFQAALGGIVFALGYWFGAGLLWFWRFLELPILPRSWKKPIGWLGLATVIALVGWYLWHASEWQNTTRALMGMPRVDGLYYTWIFAVSAAIASLLVGLLMALTHSIKFAARIPRTYVQRRIASVIGGVVFTILLVQLLNGTLVKAAITVIDEAQAAIDVSDPSGIAQPAETTRSGSAGSLVAWELIGKAGKQFVHEGPRRKDIEDFTGRTATEPIRVYVGLRSVSGTRAQADLALRELKRTRAFRRKVLVIATPTGTGWIDNAGIAPVEYMHGGNTAVVAVQYSYLQSPLSLLLEPGRSQNSAAIVFHTIYDYWKTLPATERPKLYLFGLSLGSHGSETSAPLYAYVSNAVAGAVWAGPPFRNSLWRNVQRNRNRKSTAWLPHFENGSMIRVLGPYEGPKIDNDNWGPVRIVYVVNPSDAIVFFEENMWRREPEWMKQPRAPDISPQLRWIPVITFLQVGFDMLSAASAPPGHGHNYSVKNYIDAWSEVSAPNGWTQSDTSRLKAHISR